MILLQGKEKKNGKDKREIWRDSQRETSWQCIWKYHSQLSPNSLNKICIIYLFITSTPTRTLTPTWLYLVFFVFSFLLSPTKTLTPTWFYLVFFFFYLLSSLNKICVIYLFITSTLTKKKTTTLSPVVFFFVFSYLLSPTTTLNPNVTQFSIFCFFLSFCLQQQL